MKLKYFLAFFFTFLASLIEEHATHNRDPCSITPKHPRPEEAAYDQQAESLPVQHFNG
jgi:hypothetical protein